MYTLLLLGLGAFGLAFALTPVFRNLFRGLGWLDRPDHSRKLHAQPIPRIGGIPILVAYAASLALLFVLPLPSGETAGRVFSLAWKFMPAALAVFATGLIDDLIGLRPWHKLVGQLVGAGLACWAGLSIGSIAGHAVSPWLGVPLTLLWLTACTNAFNLIDGVDGLAAGAGLVATLTTLTGALLQGHIGLALATVPLAGALLGFLRFNFNPASVFLGDCGSLTVGFLLGCYGIVWSKESTTLAGMAAPMMALSIPLLDTLLTVIRRVLRRQPVFDGDRAHIHHKLLDRGLSPSRVVLVLYGMCGIAAAFSLVESVSSGQFAGLIIVLFCLAAWSGIQYLGYVEFGIAGRLILPARLGRAVDAQIRLRSLEDALSRAVTIDECWSAICTACRELGFARAGMRLNHTVRDLWLRDPKSSAVCWTMRVPVSPTDYVNVGDGFGSLVEPSVVAPLAAVLRRCLEPKLKVLGGERAVPEGAPAYVLALPRARRELDARTAPAVILPLC
jgi:UDP-GlcNAc:undecaprenyl-phosphate GlcNAc-1-phosphate transferase